MFKDRLKEARKNAGLSQEKLGIMLGISKQTISAYEPGYSEPDMNKIMQIMKCLNVEANFLWQDEMSEPTSNRHTSSEEAMSFAERFDALSEYGKEMIRCIFRNETQYKVMKRMPHLTTQHDSVIYAQYHSKREVEEIAEERQEITEYCES